MTLLQPRIGATLALLAVLALSCGDDDPVAGDSPCDDAGTSCVSARATSSNMAYITAYDPVFDQTSHLLSWDLSSAIAFGGGQHIILTVQFDPPIEVQYDHPEHVFRLSGGSTAGCFDRFAKVTGAGVQSQWTAISGSANFSGACTTGEARMVAGALFGPLETGNKLRSVRIEFTVPEIYDAGAAQGTPVPDANMVLTNFSLDVSTSGNSEYDPPAWPEGVDLPVPR